MHITRTYFGTQFESKSSKTHMTERCHKTIATQILKFQES